MLILNISLRHTHIFPQTIYIIKNRRKLIFKKKLKAGIYSLSWNKIDNIKLKQI